MDDDSNYLFNNRNVGEDDYDNDELRAARIRLGLSQQKNVRSKRKRRRRRLSLVPDLVAKVRYLDAEERVLDEKAAEQKVARCRYCRKKIWQDLFGEQWKAEGGSPECPDAPFMSHDPDA